MQGSSISKYSTNSAVKNWLSLFYRLPAISFANHLKLGSKPFQVHSIAKSLKIASSNEFRRLANTSF